MDTISDEALGYIVTDAANELSAVLHHCIHPMIPRPRPDTYQVVDD